MKLPDNNSKAGMQIQKLKSVVVEVVSTVAKFTATMNHADRNPAQDRRRKKLDGASRRSLKNVQVCQLFALIQAQTRDTRRVAACA